MHIGRSSIAAFCLVVWTATGAAAETLSCQRTITKASTLFFHTIAKARAKCEDAVVKSGAGTCPDAKMTTAVTKAETKLAATLAKSCGGSDRTCNGDVVDEDLPAALGWPSFCPNVATELCDQPVHTCADIAGCLACLATEITTSTSTLAVGALAPSGGDRTLNTCQRAIGRANATYTAAVSRALGKCWQARMTGQHANACEPPGVGDGKYLGTIAKADAKRTATIAKACGGADHALGGSDDLTPTAIGFAAACPNAIVPGGPACGGAISDLTSIVACLDCVTDAGLACADRAAVPQLTPYPPECASCLAPPVTGVCPTTIALTANGARTDVDMGWTGFRHDETFPSNSGVTLAVSGCDGTHHPTCGECDLAGPISGAGGPSDTSRRCADHTEHACTTDADCHACIGGANADAACTTASECPGGACSDSSCVFFLGPPQGLRSAGISVCALNELTAPVSGTLNLTSGSAAASLSLRTSLYFTGSLAQPCPSCVAGACVDGARHGEPCTAHGTGQVGPVSFDCPPHPGAFAGVLPFTFPLSTDVQSRSITSANPRCRQTGFTSFNCMCDTCNDAAAEACSTNADCPASGGGPGICGGRRCVGGSEQGKPCRTCIGGTNHGANCMDASACPGGACPVGCNGTCTGGVNATAPCTTSSECPGSTCGLGICDRPGEPTQTNACYDDTATPGIDPLCIPTVNGEGACAIGPFAQRCSVDTFMPCVSTAECVPSELGGFCDGCTTANQLCISRALECFTDNGTPGNPVLAVGSPSAPCEGVARPTLSALTCTPPVASTFVNVMFGLPGLSRIRMPTEFTP